MPSSEEMNQYYASRENLRNLAGQHELALGEVKTQQRVLENTTEQMVTGYELYGLEQDLNAAGLAASSEPGLTSEDQTLLEPDPSKLLAQPELGVSLEERIQHYGYHPPVLGAEDGLATQTDSTRWPKRSILPWTPHPQHSYKDNASRVLNRTGRARPVEPS